MIAAFQLPSSSDVSVARPAPAAKVLVVDDDQAMAHVVMGHIRSHGMEAFVATSSSEVAEALRRREPDILLLDLMLKHEDGLDLLRALRKESDIPVIIMTGHRRDEIDRVVGLELGADDYLPKPFGLHELTARIRAVLRRHIASRWRWRVTRAKAGCASLPGNSICRPARWRARVRPPFR